MYHEKTISACKLNWLEQTFGLDEVEELPSLNTWSSEKMTIDDYERTSLLHFQNLLDFNVRGWVEKELRIYFIGSFMSLINYSSEKSNLFADRQIEAVIDDWRIVGNPDCFLASGRREPKIPFFILQQYKKNIDPNGDPAGQTLAGMLVAQIMNNDSLPIYGCHVIDAHWYFMSLEGKKYTISRGYSALKDDIFDIFCILKTLKKIVKERL